MTVPALDPNPSPKACISVPLEGLDTATLAAAANGDGTPAAPAASSSGAGSQADVFRLCATFKLTDSNIDPELQLQVGKEAGRKLARHAAGVRYRASSSAAYYLLQGSIASPMFSVLYPLRLGGSCMLPEPTLTLPTAHGNIPHATHTAVPTLSWAPPL